MTNTNVRVTYQGPMGLMKVPMESAKARLAYLDDMEAATKRYAPTHSGRTRMNGNKEAAAIRAAIAKLEGV